MCRLEPRDHAQHQSRGEVSTEEPLMAVGADVSDAAIARRDQCAIVRLEGGPHVQNSDSIRTDRQPITADGPAPTLQLGAGDLAAFAVEIGADSLRDRADYF